METWREGGENGERGGREESREGGMEGGENGERGGREESREGRMEG